MFEINKNIFSSKQNDLSNVCDKNNFKNYKWNDIHNISDLALYDIIIHFYTYMNKSKRVHINFK